MIKMLCSFKVQKMGQILCVKKVPFRKSGHICAPCSVFFSAMRTIIICSVSSVHKIFVDGVELHAENRLMVCIITDAMLANNRLAFVQYCKFPMYLYPSRDPIIFG